MVKIGICFSPYGKTYARYGKNKFNKIKLFGFDAVDYNIADTNSELYILDETELKQRICTEREAAHLADISISQVHGPWRYPPQDGTEQDRVERLEKMKKAIIICGLLGCENLVIHPIMPYGTHDLESGNEQETWDLNIAFFRTLVDFARQHYVTICLENMPMRNFSMSKPERILEFVKTIDDEHLKICLDTGHVAVFPNLSVGDEVRRLGNYIKVFHIHDNMGDRDSHLYPTKGIINWSDFMNSLREINFDGCYSLETAPQGDYDDERFEAESISLYQTFKELCNSE